MIIAQYDANPGGTPSFRASDAYFDVYAAPGNTFTQVNIVACSLNGADKLYWWDATTGKWLKADPQTYNSSSGCVTLSITNNSSPSLSQLQGTAFAGSISYQFIGFSQPVDNNGVLNAAKAGQMIPLKWRVLDGSGNPVTNLDPASVTMIIGSYTCPSGVTADAIETYATGTSVLQNLGDGYYQWNWKTPITYASSCKTLKLDLGEGTLHTALFQFKK